MAKTKKSAAGRSKGSGLSAVPKTAEEVQKLRTQIKNVILSESLEMARRTVQSVEATGAVTSLKFLWEVAGLFPSGDTDNDSPEPDGSLTRTLLERLGLPSDVPRPREEEED